MSWKSTSILEGKNFKSESANSVFTKIYLDHIKKVKQDLNYIQKIIKHDLVSRSDQKHSL